MANNTAEYWSIDGTSLHQFGWSVATVGGSRYDLPPRRGDNIRFAYRPGAVHRPKLADSRTINLLMWVTGADPATGAATTDAALRFNDSWNTLRKLVWKPGGSQVELTRRWYLTVGGVKTLVTASALAEIADTMPPTMTGRTRADFTMTLLLADPYFYGPEVTTTIGMGETATITNSGDDTAMHANLEIDFTNVTNATLTNSTASPDVWLQATGTIGAGVVTFDVGAYTAISNTGESHIMRVRNGGSRHWFALLPGANTVTLSGTGSGSAVVRFRPPYV